MTNVSRTARLAALAAAVLLLLAACSAPEPALMMRRISPLDGKCYFYVPLTWTDETTDPEKELRASRVTDAGTYTVSLTTEEYEVEEESEAFWEHWLSDEWWDEFWQKETKPSWSVESLDTTVLTGQTGYLCVYTEGGARHYLTAIVTYSTCYRLHYAEPLTGADQSDYEAILSSFLWK